MAHERHKICSCDMRSALLGLEPLLSFFLSLAGEVTVKSTQGTCSGSLLSLHSLDPLIPLLAFLVPSIRKHSPAQPITLELCRNSAKRTIPGAR